MTELQRWAQREIDKVDRFLADIKMKDGLVSKIPMVGQVLGVILSMDSRSDWHRYRRELVDVVEGRRHTEPEYPDTTIS